MKPTGDWYRKFEAQTRERGVYGYTLELGDSLRIDVTLDLQNGRQRAHLARSDRSAEAEVFWERGRGYGRRLPGDRWFRLSGAPYPDMLQGVVALMRAERGLEVEETGEGTIAEWAISDTPLQRDPSGFFAGLAGADGQSLPRHWSDALAKAADGLRILARATIESDRHWIRSASFTVESAAKSSYSFLSFQPGPLEVPGLPEAALDAAERPFPASMLLMQLPRWGWSASTCHGPWAQAALDRVEETDPDGAYGLLYDDTWSTTRFDYAAAKSGLDPAKHHPVVVGAVHEDTGELPKTPYEDWFTSDGAYASTATPHAKGHYLRDFHHFGGGDTGLADKWYFFMRAIKEGPTPATTKPGDRFYSARDWGFGGGRIDPNLNHLTFCDAIAEFNRNSFDGRRRAYLMLGHVLHLLQDQGMPDHARLVDHAGSSMAEIDIFAIYCPIIALEIAGMACAACGPLCLGCAIGAFGIAEGICLGLVESDEVGYEKLISDNPPKIGYPAVENLHDYDTFFAKMATFSDGATTMKSALGCSGLTVPPLPTIPNVNPDINANNASETKPFFDLTDTLLPKVVGYGAGMLQHFHDIVNPPPFVQRLAIVQWAAGDTPREFAFFASDKEHCKRYDAEWVISGSGRILKKTANQQVSTDRPIYFFVLFGPAEVKPDKGRVMRKAVLRVKGTDLLTGKQIDEEVRLTAAYDANLGHYYWGSHMPHNCANDPVKMQIEIVGEDLGAHLATRAAPGNVLDSDPSKIPFVDLAAKDLALKNYLPGSDTTHDFTIGKLEWEGFEAVPDTLTVGRSETVKLSVKQIQRDCQWEKRPGPVTCPVTWKIETTLQDVELVRGMLLIRPDRRKFSAGQYAIKITCTLGTMSQTKVVQVTVT